MADLLDIAPTTASQVVWINGTRIVVRGLNAPAVASIIARFPKMVGLLIGGDGVDITSRFIQDFGDATAPLIAAGCGHAGDEKYEQFARTQLALEDQLKLVKAIIGATCPNGLGFFLEAIGKIIGAGEEAKPQKIRLKKSRLPSPLSSEPDSRQIM
jgi:hypothetical protein